MSPSWQALPRRLAALRLVFAALPALVRGTLILTACDGSTPRGAAPNGVAASNPRPADGVADSARGTAGAGATAARQVAFRVPSDSELPDGPVGASIRRGRALLTATRDSLPAHVRASLACTNCHPGNGTRPNAMPWVGVYARFPQYRSRSGSVNIIEDRVNDCFERSMNGRAIPAQGRDMRDIVAYMAWLSRGVPVGADVPGQGLPKMTPLPGDTTRGAQLFAAECARCHGPGGEGTVAAPPTWGPRSFNIGAGMARLRTAAAFVRYNMPYDRPGTLTDQQAFDVAAYITSRPRPDFPGKENDWPNGDPPPDAAYETVAAKRKASAARASPSGLPSSPAARPTPSTAPSTPRRP
jgi:thiosulfate dehydrogenase